MSEAEGYEEGGKAVASAGKEGSSAVDDEAAMKDIMMTRKTKKFYERVQRAQLGKRERVEELESRKAKLSSNKPQKSEAAASQPPQKRRK